MTSFDPNDFSYHMVNQLTRNDHPQYQLVSGMTAFQKVANNPTTLVQSLTAGTDITVSGGDGSGHGTLTVTVTQDASWTNVSSFTNSWVAFGSPELAPGWRKVGERVYLRGCMKSGSIGSAAFTLPAGYRPSGTIAGPANSNGAFGAFSITSAGVFTPVTGNATSFFLDGITFDTL